MKTVSWQGNALLGLALAVLGLIGVVWLVPAQVEQIQGFGLPSYTYPRLILGLLTFTGAMMAVESRGRRTAQPVEGEPITPAVMKSVGGMVLMVALFALGMLLVGFFIATAAFMLGCLWIFDERSPVVLISLSLLVPLGIYAIFTGALKLVLP